MVRQAEETSGQGTLDPSPGGAEEATLEVVTRRVGKHELKCGRVPKEP